MFNVEMIPVAHGDAILVEIGGARSVRRILVDGGPWSTYDAVRKRLAAIKSRPRHLDLLVITHVDTDHSDGVIKLLQDQKLGLEIGEVWFNGYQHVHAAGKLGGKQGEFLEVLIEDQQLGWNTKFGGEMIAVPKSGKLPERDLGKLHLTILSPGVAQLAALEKDWVKALRTAGFSAGDRKTARAQLKRLAIYGPPAGMLGKTKGTTAANASSIAMLLEYDGRKVLLAGDASADVLESSIRMMKSRTPKPLELDAFKLPHHGSFSNLTPALVDLAPAKHYLVSTNGGASYNHPDKAAIELILKVRKGKAPDLVFNHKSKTTSRWADRKDQRQRGYTAQYPAGGLLRL